MKFSSQGKVVIVTGGTTGIGYSIVSQLYQSGCRVIITSRSEKRAKKAAATLDPGSDKVIGVGVNYNYDSEINSLVALVLDKFRKVDVLINNTGIFAPFGPFESKSMREHLKNLQINLIGAMRYVHKVIPLMKKQRSGKIIMLSGGGVGGDKPLAHASSYYVSKTAIAAFTEVLAAELKNFNVQVNAILPGQILTNLTKTAFDISPEVLGEELSGAMDNLRKYGGQPLKPVLDLVSILISDRSNHLTGRLFSARWDNLNDLLDNLPDEKYKLRRIDGKVYQRSNNS